jgi:hypothetical protein
MKMKMSDAAVVNSMRRMPRWRRLAWSLGAATGLLWLVPGAWLSSGAAQGSDYRSAAAAPAAWQAFAGQLQSRFQERLAADDAAARSFQDTISKRQADNKPLTLIVRSWILPGGKIERVEFDGLNDDSIAVNLRALLINVVVDAPPPDMLQPLRLRFSLRPKDASRQGG